MSERWLAVPGFDGLYEVSDVGAVRSYAPWGGGVHGRRTTEPRPLKPKRKGRYLEVRLQGAGRNRYATVHSLVLLAFVGPRPAGHQGAHSNGESFDNRLSNLSYQTILENNHHKRVHGTVVAGERQPNRTLTARMVEVIRSRYRAGEPQQRLAADYGVSQAHISRIVLGKSWRNGSPTPPSVLT